MNRQKYQRKTNKAAAVAKVNEHQYVAALQEIPIKSLTRKKNPLKKLEINNNNNNNLLPSHSTCIIIGFFFRYGTSVFF